jgi:2-isopropylmalate synthase
MSEQRLIVFDTTLRDGEQSPGAAMTREEKLRIAHALERLRVDVIEAGFPASSPGDFEAVRAVAAQVKDAVVCALARTAHADIERAAEALAPARARRIHTFIATSALHMEKKLRMTPEAVVDAAVSAVRHARRYTDDVEFSAEDAGRSDLEFLCRIFEAVIEAGATTVNVPDTVGYNVPHQFAEKFRTLMARIPNADRAVFSAHCHNDLGLAVANSLAAVLAGARQVECAINGLGERAGNASLEEIVMAVRTRQDVFPCDTRVDTRQLLNCSKLVSTVTGFHVQPNKAVVGANAFAHESGIHQDGVIKSRETYEIMRAQDVGWAANRLSLGKLSGRSAFRQRMAELGVEFASEEVLLEAFRRFKELADKKREIYDDDLISLVTDLETSVNAERYKLIAMRASAETGEPPQATVTLALDGAERTATASGSGSVDATFNAIEQIAGSGARLELYSVQNLTAGTDAMGEVLVRLARDGVVANGHGSDTDIVIASGKAYVSCLNHLEGRVARTALGGV